MRLGLETQLVQAKYRIEELEAQIKTQRKKAWKKRGDIAPAVIQKNPIISVNVQSAYKNIANMGANAKRKQNEVQDSEKRRMGSAAHEELLYVLLRLQISASDKLSAYCIRKREA